MYAVTAVAASALATACPATHVHREALPRSGDLSHLAWVQATPRRAGIVGVLFGTEPKFVDVPNPVFTLYAHGRSPTGYATKILWIIRNSHAGGRVDVRGRQLDGRAVFFDRFSEVSDASPHPAAGHEYASIIDLPAAGCWRLTVDSSTDRRVRGTLVVRAVAP